MLRRAEGFLGSASALAIAGFMVSTAAAQSPVLSLPTVTAGPGETVTVPLYLSGVPEANAVNFTIRVSEADRALIDETVPMGFSLPAGIAGNYTYEFNTLNYDDPGTGAVENIWEYRGVLYPRDSSIQPFSANSNTVIVHLKFPIAPDVSSASDLELDLMIVNQFAPDGITGLVGISDGSGNSVVSGPESPAPGGMRNIAKGDGKIVIEAAERFDFATEFPDGWEAIQRLPTYGKLLPKAEATVPPADIALDFDHSTATGFSATNQLNSSQGTTAFGYVETEYTNRLTEGLVAGKVLAAKWNVMTNVTNPFDSPAMRLRVSSDGFTQISIFQEITPDPSLNPTNVIPLASDGVTPLNTMSYIPEVALNNSVSYRKGLLFSFDLLAEGDAALPGSPGSVVTLDSIDYLVLDPATFTGEAQIVSEDYSTLAAGTNLPGGYGYIPFFDSSTDPALTAEPYTAGGVGFRLGGPAPNAERPYFAYGVMQKTLVDGGPVQVDGTKVYKVDFSVKSGASQPIFNNTLRLRVWSLGLDYTQSAVLETAGPDADNSYLPDADGQNYTMWVDFPPVLDGRSIVVSIDGYNTLGAAEIPGKPTDPTTIQVTNFTMTAYDRPPFLVN